MPETKTNNDIVRKGVEISNPTASLREKDEKQGHTHTAKQDSLNTGKMLHPEREFFGGMKRDEVEKHLQTLCLLILTVYASAVVFKYMKDILMPFVMGMFIAVLFIPLIDRMSQIQTCRCNRRLIRQTKSWRNEKLAKLACGRREKVRGKKQKEKFFLHGFWANICESVLRLVSTGRIPYTLAVVISLFLGFSLFGVVGKLVTVSLEEFYNEKETYEREAETLIGDFATRLNQVGFTNVTSDSLKETLGEKINLSTLIESFLSELLHFVHLTIAVLIFVVYVLLCRKAVPDHKEGWLQTRDTRDVDDDIADQIKESIQTYLVTKAVLSFIAAVLFTTILLIFRIKMAVLFGVLSFCLDFIPNVGCVIATFLPLPIMLLDPEVGTLNGFICFVIICLMQAILGEVVEPVVMGHSMEVHPIVVLNALLFFGTVWGIPGMVLAVPLLVIIKIVLLEVNHPFAQAAVRVIEGFPSKKDDHENENEGDKEQVEDVVNLGGGGATGSNKEMVVPVETVGIGVVKEAKKKSKKSILTSHPEDAVKTPVIY